MVRILHFEEHCHYPCGLAQHRIRDGFKWDPVFMLDGVVWDPWFEHFMHIPYLEVLASGERKVEGLLHYFS